MINKELYDKINDAALCLMGIHDDWEYFEIEQFLDWQLDNMDDIAEGYPLEVMTREYEPMIMNEVERMLLLKKETESNWWNPRY